MPLPPLPDPASLDGPGHIDDSAKLRAYLIELAAGHNVPIDDIPLPDPGKAGHVAWHGVMASQAKKVADAIGASVILPPLSPKVDDLGHVTDHNTLRKALADMASAIPFVIEGDGVPFDIGYSNWVSRYFAQPGTYTITVKGSGQVQALVVGGGGGRSGFSFGQSNDAYGPGPGGGGCVAEVTSTSDDLPWITLTSGTYQIVVGDVGTNGTDRIVGGNGGDSSLTGKDVALLAKGGGGGGTADTPGQSAGTGGAGGWYQRYDETYSVLVEHRESAGGRGNPGGNGVAPMQPATNMAIQVGAGGGACGDATWPGTSPLRGPGYQPPPYVADVIDAAGYQRYECGTGGWSGQRVTGGPGTGAPAALLSGCDPANPGFVALVWKKGS